MTKDGYDPYEVWEDIGTGRKKIVVELKKTVSEGELAVRTEPPGAMIYLDGRSVGKSPYEGKGLTPKRYKIRISLEGFEVWEGEETVELGKKVIVLAQLRAKLGELEVRSEPPGATVLIDGKGRGKTPLVLFDMKLGQHLLQVLHEGYESYADRVEITGVDRKKVVVNLKRVVWEGELTVRTDPQDAAIYLDGKSVGTGSYEGKGLSPKSYRLKVTREGYEVWERDIGVEIGKKLEVLANLKEKKEIAWAQKKLEAPLLKVGDQWTYKDATGLIWTDEIVNDKEGLYIMKRGGVKFLLGYNKKTMNETHLIREGGRPEENKSVFGKFLDFPIFVGKTWTETITSTPIGGGSKVPYVCDYKIEDIEEITTPAGTFKALRILYKQTNTTSGHNGWICYWFSPEAKTWVKREFEKSPYWTRIQMSDAELISYRLK